MGEAWLQASLSRLRHRLDRALPEQPARTPRRDELKREAHQLVADAGQLGLRELAGACSALEQACISEADLDPALAQARHAAARARVTAELLLAHDAHG